MKVQLSSLFVVCVLALTACPELKPEPLEKAPRVTRFTASRALVNADEAVTLSWETTDATEVRLDEAASGQITVEATSGSVEVTVSKNALYVLTARNGRGATHRAVVAVNVRETMNDVLLTAMPREVDVGEPVTLAWSAPNASELTLVASPGGPVDLGGQLSSGTVTVLPTQTTTYTLTAGTRTADAVVTVRPTLLTFTASTDAIDPTDAGASLTLSWTSANATRVQLLTPGRPVLLDSTDAGVVTGGSFTDQLAVPIDPSRVYRYELRLESEGRTAVGVISLPVRGSPGITSFTAPAFARVGGPIEVSWSTVGAESVSIYAGTNELHRTANAEAAATGSVTLTAPSDTLLLELVARSARAGEARQNLEVQVVGTPAVTLGMTPATVMRGTPYQLTWSGQSVRNLKLYGEDSRLLLALTDIGDTGTLPLTLVAGAAERFVLVADNTLGEVAISSLTVQPPDALELTPSVTGTLRAGQRVGLSWPGGETLYALPNDEIALRPTSTGFDDISASGTRVVFPGTAFDDEVASITTTFRAPFYGRIVGETVSVSTNGYITFGPGNRLNFTDVALPTAKLEPLSIAPYWEDLLMVNGQVHWQVKPSGTDQVLIVQWTNAATSSATGFNFQLKFFSTGQIDFEYQTMTATLGQSGIQGPRGDEGVVLGRPVASALGATFFAPRQSPTTFVARSREPARAFLRAGSNWVPVSARFDVVFPEELQLGEALLEPDPLVGNAGRWLEFVNTRNTPISLDGWNLSLADGGVVPLSGTVAAGGVRVFGASADRALNDDAGVDVALLNFNVNGGRDSLTWGRDGTFGALSWNNPPTGIAQATEYGPFRIEGDVVASPSRPRNCFASARYGQQNPQQRGTPGDDVSCGFGYAWSRTSPGYYDISTQGHRLVGPVNTSGLQRDFDLSSAPFPFFGTPRSAVRVSSDGYLTFDLDAPNNTFSTTAPLPTAPNSVLAVYADDMGGRVPESGIFTRRVPANEDPWAAAPHWIVQWHHWSGATNDDVNFQVKLFDDGVIEYHFGDLRSTTSAAQANGGSANTWVENATGTQALVINASSLTPGISPHTAYRISPR